MLYYKCVKDGNVVGTTESPQPILSRQFIAIGEEEYRKLAGVPEPTKPEPTETEDTAALLVDHEYRLTLLELGITE